MDRYNPFSLKEMKKRSDAIDASIREDRKKQV
jgi:hypothetical protein